MTIITLLLIFVFFYTTVTPNLLHAVVGLLLVACALFVQTAQAQDRRPDMSWEKMQDMQIDFMAQSLSLSDKDTEKLKEVYKEYSKEMRTLMGTPRRPKKEKKNEDKTMGTDEHLVYSEESMEENYELLRTDAKARKKNPFFVDIEYDESGENSEPIEGEDLDKMDLHEAEIKNEDEETDLDEIFREKKNEDGSYTTAEDVALYIHTYGCLPKNFISKKEAQALGWEGGSLEPYAPGMCIGGSHFGNFEGLLPEKKGRKYTECDIDTLGKKSRGAKRIVFSNDGLIYYTDDHYESFEQLY